MWVTLSDEDGSVIYLHNCFWALPEQSLLGQSPAELTTRFYCLFWDSPYLEGQVPVFISPRNRVAQLYPWALGSLLSPLTTRRYSNPLQHGMVLVTLRPTVSRPVCLGVEAHDEIFITIRHLRSSCCGAPSRTRGRLCNFYSYILLPLSGPSPAELMTTPYGLIWDPTQEGQVPVFISPRNSVAQKKESNCQSKQCKIWSPAPNGARHQDELADWPSVAI
jgi:hypothetical protein